MTKRLNTYTITIYPVNKPNWDLSVKTTMNVNLLLSQ